MSTLVTNGSFITNKLSDIMLTLTPIKPFKRNLAIFLSGRVLEYEINKKWMELFKTHFENDFNISINHEKTKKQVYTIHENKNINKPDTKETMNE